MIANIFSSQPSYEGDLAKCVRVMGQTIAKTLERIESVILYLNCDNEDAVEGLVDLVTYTTGEIKFLVHRIYRRVVGIRIPNYRGYLKLVHNKFTNLKTFEIWTF